MEEEKLLLFNVQRFFDQITSIPREGIIHYLDESAFGTIDYPLEIYFEKDTEKINWKKDGF